jgi:hypothetical protein
MKPLIVMDSDAILFAREQSEKQSLQSFAEAVKKEVRRLEREGYVVLLVKPGARVSFFAPPPNGTAKTKRRT